MREKKSKFIETLGPLFKLGTEHEAMRAVQAALAGEAADLMSRAVDLETKGEDRAWWSGAAAATQVMVEEIAGELAARRREV